MALNESDTRAKLIDPAIHACGWTEGLIRREETAGAIEIEIEEGRTSRRARGRVDYVRDRQFVASGGLIRDKTCTAC